MKNIYSLLLVLLISTVSSAQVVNIPDANFKNYLLNNASINTNSDAEIQESEALAYTGILDVENLNISDLTGVNSFRNIYGLQCSDNNISTLYFSSNMNFTFLECDNNNLYSLLFASNANLQLNSISCSNNDLSGLDLEYIPDLIFLNCSQNSITNTNFNLASNLHLEYLDCGGNDLTSLDLSNKPQLNFIKISNNSIPYIDLTNKPFLTTLYAGNNELFNLDFDFGTPLTTVKCQNNNLSFLNLFTGQNNDLTTMNATGNPDLTCIAVDNGPDANAGNGVYASWQKDVTASYNTNTCGDCIVAIPDANFKTYLVSNTLINLDGDAEIDCFEAQAFTGTIHVDGLGISDLTGIETFTSLNVLSCKNNSLTDLDLTTNTALTEIYCNGNSLTSLVLFNDLTDNLQILNCKNNNLTILDVQHCNDLLQLNCSYNYLTSLYPPSFLSPQITTLRAKNNNLTSLIINQGEYEIIDVSNNQLTNFTMSNTGYGLEKLYCSNNLLPSIPITYATDIQILECDTNAITGLDLDNHPSLTTLLCQNNDLNLLNLKNGNNAILTTMNATNNPNLVCIDVDNELDAIAGNGNYAAWQKDPVNIAGGAGYSEDCSCTVYIPDTTFKNYLLSETTINTNGNAEIECSEAVAFSFSFNFDSYAVSDLTGIASFVNLDQLHCPNNNISLVDLSQNTALTYLNIANNNLVGLDLSNNTALTEVYVGSNSLIELDLSNNPAITTLYCPNNNLLGLNLKNANNAIFTTMDATNNPDLSCIEVQIPANANAGTGNYATWQIDATATYMFNCADCIIDIPDVNFKAYLIGNPAINTNSDSEIQCSEALSFDGTIAPSGLSVSDLTGIESFPLIDFLFVDTNILTSIDISNNTALTHFNCQNNNLTSLDVAANTSLTYFHCQGNDLISLNLKNGYNTLLANMNASNNPDLTCIEVDSASDAITGNGSYATWVIDATTSYSNNCNECLVSIPDANFKAYLVGDTNINTNGDTEIQCAEASSFTGTIWAMSHNIADLTGIEAFTALTRLDCYNNQLTSLNVSQNTALEILYCRYNQLTELDVSQNPNLNVLVCNNNLLNSLNVKNGNNTAIVGADFNATNNSNLFCIEVDNAADATAGNASYAGWLKDAATSYSEDCSACIVNIPDANFKAYLVGESAINTNGDSEIQCSEANAYTGQIGAWSLNISDLTGIEAFPLITALYCYNNNLTSIDLSSNTLLVYLRVDSNALSSLDVSNNTDLISIHCYNNNLTSLDISNNVALNTLDCFFNNLTSLDVTNNAALNDLSCDSNNLTSLDVSNNVNLDKLSCANNSLTILDVSNLTLLKELYCSYNTIATLNLSNNTDLESLSCDFNNLSSLDTSNNILLYEVYGNDNAITSLDFSLNPLLEYLYCENNNLLSLSIKNGNNGPSDNFDATNNPDLFCIEVDDEAYANTNTSWDIDATASYSEDCDCILTIPDANFKAYLLGNTSINPNLDAEIQCFEAAAFTGIIDAGSLNISDLTGIEAFENLTSLNVNFNSLASIDLSSNLSLENLSCRANNLTSLDVSFNTALSYLNCRNNAITDLDLTNNIALITLICRANDLSSLNLKNGQNALLTTMEAVDNTNLLCIEVDDETAATAGSGVYATWLKDATASYSEDCDAYLDVDDFNLTQLKIFPNPTQGLLQIQSLNSGEYAVSDSRGRFIKRGIINNGDTSLDISELPQGIYFLTLQFEAFRTTKKVLKN